MGIRAAALSGSRPLLQLSTMAAEGDFLMRYRAVSNKLKKRFLRKPNVAEASEQFGQLAKELKQQDCPQYAAFCNLAIARCEQTLFNAPGEALALTDAARLFLASEQETRALRAPGFDENMQAAMNCYSFAIKVYIEMNHPVMAASLSLELGNALKEMNRPSEAMVHFQRAAELQIAIPIESLLSLWEMAFCKILTRDYDGALAVLSEMQLMCQERGLQLPGTNTPVHLWISKLNVKSPEYYCYCCLSLPLRSYYLSRLKHLNDTPGDHLTRTLG
ncbi:40-kDa huntingtin-associated protein-like isoform X3 [Xyrauchen texanus]|uniref:40-kDa huntingtin-associated protein-like isoform X3 n=1 Tax=Xyrauchen texanus TaxID=154827 RepID=UPI0022423F49|nr:40-kDa huntingtin-associated protein-like isoform X3 [Xyrauchen texanus]